MKKYLILLVLILLTNLASAYYPGQSIIIPAMYLEDGIKSNAGALITINYPNSTNSVLNATMVNVSTGIFSYNYTFANNTIGNYNVYVDFYNGTTLTGSVQDILEVNSDFNTIIGNITDVNVTTSAILKSQNDEVPTHGTSIILAPSNIDYKSEGMILIYGLGAIVMVMAIILIIILIERHYKKKRFMNSRTADTF